MSYWQVVRDHEIHCGHRVYGHEGSCKNFHGHEYWFAFGVESVTPAKGWLKECELDKVGRVIDFGQIKTLLCGWLDKQWDHRFLIWKEDPVAVPLKQLDPAGVVILSCNPTVENLARYFAENIAPGLLLGTGVRLAELRLWETSKCSVIYRVEGNRNDAG